jgi:hypothetical protein
MSTKNSWFRCINFLLSVLLASTTFASGTECWSESKACTLAGSLELHTFLDGKDEPETNLYLKLNPSILVHFKDWDHHDAPATEMVTLMEIAGDFDSRLFKIAKSKNHAKVKAKIFEQQTAHHHTRFLIDATSNIIVDKK